jgi:CRISPR-associated endonuclease/helicase Cas3
MDIEFLNQFRFFNDYKSGHKIIKKNKIIFETLYQHSKSVLKFYDKFLSERKIEVKLKFLSKNLNLKLNTYLWKLIFFHDLGKLNRFTQDYFLSGIKINDTEHSKISFLLIILYFYDDFRLLTKKGIRISDRNEEIIFSEIILLFSYVTAFHHSNLFNFSNDIVFDGKSFNINFGSVLRYILNEKKEIIESIIKSYEGIFKFENYINLYSFKNKNFLKKEELFQIFFQIKQFYSLLVLSDYYATFCFQNGLKVEGIKINQIDLDLINKIEKNFHYISYNRRLLNAENLKLKKLEECRNLNELRNNLIIQATQSLNFELEKKDHSKIFMLNVPTGGGKTNISLKLALEILKKTQVNRVNWVFPYVNIIEQNTNVIKESYFKNDKNLIIKHLSQIYHDSINLEDVDKFTNLEYYENSKINLLEKKLNLDFINNSINIISTVNFFNMLFKVKRNNRYKFANFVNSIVIIDEIQTINAENMDTFYQVLGILSRQFNMYFIIMSATLPDINKFNKIKDKESNVIHLITNYTDYYKHEIFKRNKVEFIKKRYEKKDLIEHVQKLKETKRYNKILIVLNTIKSSLEIFENLKESEDNWEILILNSYVTRNMKNKIIDYVKANDNIILVSTQSIEAGVDLDFDVAIRDRSIIDSIEQVSGRVNRECNQLNKNDKKVYVINYLNESEKIYRSDERFKYINDDFFELRDFDSYYEEYFSFIKKKQSNSTMRNYIHSIESLSFNEVSDLRLIKNKFSISLVFNDILEEVKEDLDYKINNFDTIERLLNLKEDKDNDFLNKPLFDFISKIISKNSVSLNFYNYEDMEHFLSFLKNKNYLVNKNINISENKIIIVNNSFYHEYYSSYKLGSICFKYFNVLKLKNLDFEKYKKEDLSGIFI